MLKIVQNELHDNWVTEDALLHVNEEMWAAMRLPPSLYPNIGLAIKLMNGWKDGAAGSRMAQDFAAGKSVDDRAKAAALNNPAKAAPKATSFGPGNAAGPYPPYGGPGNPNVPGGPGPYGGPGAAGREQYPKGVQQPASSSRENQFEDARNRLEAARIKAMQPISGAPGARGGPGKGGASDASDIGAMERKMKMMEMEIHQSYMRKMDALVSNMTMKGGKGGGAWGAGFNAGAQPFDPNSGSGWGNDQSWGYGYGDESWKYGADGMPAALDFNVKPEHLAAAQAANASVMKNSWQSDPESWNWSGEQKKTWDDVVNDAKNAWLGSGPPGAEKSAGGRPDDAEIADVFARKAASGWGDTGGWGGTGTPVDKKKETFTVEDDDDEIEISLSIRPPPKEKMVQEYDASDEVELKSLVAGSTEPAEEKTEPAEEKTEPAEEKTEPAEEQTEPAAEKTEPAEENAEPAEATAEATAGD
jgi:hypothetical protein